MSQALPIAETFSAIESYINEANDIIARGEVIELKTLDERVKVMCDAIAGMSKDDAAKHKEDLQRLMTDLEKLQGTLVENKDKLKTELTGVQSHSVASNAYNKSGALAPKGE